MSLASKAERLINLMAMLLDAGRPVSLADIQGSVYRSYEQDFPAFKRMFERDKSELRELGVPIETQPLHPLGEEADGYFIPKDAYYLPEIEFSPDERVALIMLKELVAAGRLPLSRDLASAFMKLSPDLGPLSPPESSLPCRVDLAAENEANLEPLLDAVLRRKTVHFLYRSLRNPEPQERTLDPYGLYGQSGRWYLVGFDYLRDALRSFRVSRIQDGVELFRSGEGPDFDVPRDFDLDSFSSKQPWEFDEGEETTATIRFAPRIAWWVEQSFAARYNYTTRPDGAGVLELSVRNLEALLSWVLSFGEDAEILGPPELRHKMREWLEEAKMAWSPSESGGA